MSVDPQVVQKIASAAIFAERITGCPADLIAAQCALESGWLKSAPGNNCFGIKEYDGCPGVQLLSTHEWFNDLELANFLKRGGGREAVKTDKPPRNGRDFYDVKDCFATFPDLGACFKKRATMWDRGPYAAAANRYRANLRFDEYLQTIAPIYATDPNYAKEIYAVLDTAGLKEAVEAARTNVLT